MGSKQEKAKPAESDIVDIVSVDGKNPSVSIIGLSCNLPNEQLDAAEWNRIEAECVIQEHLKADESLRAVIEQDEQAVAGLFITFEQLGHLFKKIKYHYQAAERIEFPKPVIKAMQARLKVLNPLSWCAWGFHCKMLFQGKIAAACIVWGGSERCSFQSPADERYHGYEYGDRDWFFMKAKVLHKEEVKPGDLFHIGDLLFHSIAKHHFFESVQGLYRVDPTRLIDFFGVQPGRSYKPETHVKKFWSTCSDMPNYLASHYKEILADAMIEKIRQHESVVKFVNQYGLSEIEIEFKKSSEDKLLYWACFNHIQLVIFLFDYKASVVVVGGKKVKAFMENHRNRQIICRVMSHKKATEAELAFVL